MNILLVTELYPGFAGQSAKDVSYVLHHLVRQWIKEENVWVARTYFVPRTRPGKKGSDREGSGDGLAPSKIAPGMFNLEGVNILKCPVYKVPKLRLFYYGHLFRKLKKAGFRPGVVLGHLGFNILIGEKIARHYHVPYIAAVHYGDLLSGQRMIGARRLEYLYSQAAGIANRSYPVLWDFSRRYPYLQERCFVAYSGIEKELVEDNPFALAKLAQWKTKTGANQTSSSPIRLLTVCNLIKRKNIDKNLQALAQLANSCGGQWDWHYTIIGEGEERAHLEELAATLGIREKVRLPGHQPREVVLAEMKQSHIFLMVSERETFGIVYLEAMATGNIVIGASGCGIDGIIEHGKHGFLCTPGDKGEIFKLLGHIINEASKAELEQVLINSHERVLAYTEEKAARNYLENIYQAVSRARASKANEYTT